MLVVSHVVKSTTSQPSDVVRRQGGLLYPPGRGSEHRPAVFCRFAGCNLWSGREKDRDEAICQFCDTDFVGTDGPGGGRFATPDELAAEYCLEHPEWRLSLQTHKYIGLA